jgi:nitrite reductase/ring-hydroxylating ferredoxin subunit
MNTLNRRQFAQLLNRGLAFSGLVVIATPIVAYFYPPKLEETPMEPVQVAPEGEMPLNASRTVPYGRYPALVIHTPEGLRAYSAVCTHFGCIVKWNSGTGQIDCPCHEGYFDPLDGHVLSGPPPTPLVSIPVNVVDGQIYIGGEA